MPIAITPIESGKKTELRNLNGNIFSIFSLTVVLICSGVFLIEFESQKYAKLQKVKTNKYKYSGLGDLGNLPTQPVATGSNDMLNSHKLFTQ